MGDHIHDDSPCPVSDPSCEGGEGDCHDACEPVLARTLESVTVEVLDVLSHNDDRADDYYSAADVVSYMLDLFGEPPAPFKYADEDR